MWLALLLSAFPAAIAGALLANLHPTWVIVIGLILFGVVFALNSAVHSYLILASTDNNKVAMNVGFYYMANALGRLGGTILSGLLYQYSGLIACLWVSAALAAIAGVVSMFLPVPQGKASLASIEGGE
jgi:predicted MFS family arabinose efflux permease